jgi:hypothetical protein
MKRILIASLAILLISSAIESYALTAAVQAVCGANSSGCLAASNEIGNRNVEATNSALAKNYSYAALYTADCTGTINTGYFYHNDTTDGTNIKIGVYLDDGDNVPDSGDTKVVVSGSLDVDTTSGWLSVAINSGNVVNGSNYWIVVMLENELPVNTNTARSSSGSARFSLGSSGHYTSPPATLDGTWTSLGEGSWSWYVTIGD